MDGEDYGDFVEGRDVFLGSRYFAANLPQDFDPEFGVLLDMVGDRDLDIYVEGNSNRLAPEIIDRVWNIAQRMGFGDVFHRRVDYTMNDDHIPLNEVGIPTIDVIDFDNYPYWHTPDDNTRQGLGLEPRDRRLGHDPADLSRPLGSQAAVDDPLTGGATMI